MPAEQFASLHPGAAGPVDDDRLARLVYVVIHAKVGRHSMDHHTMVGRHVRELLEGTEVREGLQNVKKIGKEKGETEEAKERMRQEQRKRGKERERKREKEKDCKEGNRRR